MSTLSRSRAIDRAHRKLPGNINGTDQNGRNHLNRTKMLHSMHLRATNISQDVPVAFAMKDGVFIHNKTVIDREWSTCFPFHSELPRPRKCILRTCIDFSEWNKFFWPKFYSKNLLNFFSYITMWLVNILEVISPRPRGWIILPIFLKLIIRFLQNRQGECNQFRIIKIMSYIFCYRFYLIRIVNSVRCRCHVSCRQWVSVNLNKFA